MNCTNCGIALEAGARFCLDCGTEVPQVKACVKCGVQLSPAAKFCSQCGAKQDGSGSTGGLAMGNKNVVAGDVIGSKEETHIAGHATIIKNEDETKKIVKCHECGKWMQVIEGYECRKCHQFTCPSCYNTSARSCHCCFQEEAVQKAPLEDQKSAMKVELMESERMILERAWTLLYEKDRPRQALALVEPLYQEHREDEAVLGVYLPILAWCNPQLAVELADSLCHVEGYKVQIEEAIRRRDTVQAERRLQEAKERWPGQVSLQLLEVVVKIALYRDYKEEPFLEEGRKILSAMSNPENSVERSWQYLLKAFLNNEDEGINVTSGAFVQNGLCWHVVSRFFFLLHGLKMNMNKGSKIACGVNSSTGMLYWRDQQGIFIANSHGNMVEKKKYDSAGRLECRREASYDNQGNIVGYKEYDSAGRLEKRLEASYDNQGNEVEKKRYDSAGRLEKRWESSYDNQGNEVEKKKYDSSGRLEWREEYSYDNQGNQVEEKEYDSAGRLRVEASYDNQGNLVEVKEYDSSGRLECRREASYDNQGNEVERKQYDSAGRLEWREESSYDNQGNEVEKKEYDSSGRLEYESSYDNQGNEMEKKKYDSSGRLEWREESSYDNQGNEVEKKKYDSSGRLEWREEYSYDNQGNLVEGKLYDSAGRLRVESSYDNQGNLVEEKEYDSSGRLEYEYSYDNQGNLVEVKQYDSSGRLECRGEFSYDNQGNLVEKKKYDSAGRLENRVESSYDNQGNLVEEKEYEY